MCLAILVSLLKRGVPPGALAYIKPVTQCEAEQPVTLFCNRVGIANRGVGPVVFYKGFTRAYLNGETGPAEALLEEAKTAVEEISQNKLFVLVDGVGYPSVGSICNLSNADVAKKLASPVLLVGKSGVGDAVDSYNLNSAFFESKGVKVLGGIFNKLPLDGYYSLENCKEAVTMYFQQYKRQEMPYGFVPTIDAKPTDEVSTSITAAVTIPDMDTTDSTSMDTGTVESILDAQNEFTEFENQLSEAFMTHVDLDRLMHDVWIHEV
jgi:dethiobiotin synthetase